MTATCGDEHHRWYLPFGNRESKRCRRLHVPIGATLELTHRCDHHCAMCGVPESLAATPELFPEQWLRVIDRLRNSVAFYTISGGEPLLSPAFSQVVGALETHSVIYSVATTADWRSLSFDPVTLLRDRAGLYSVLVALHGSTPAIHDAITGSPGAFQATVASLSRMKAAKLPLATGTVITGTNYTDVANIVTLAMSLGLECCMFYRLIHVRTCDVVPTFAQFQTAAQTLVSLRREGFPVWFGNAVPQCLAGEIGSSCLAGLAYLTVGPDARVRQCNHSDRVIGNLLADDLATIWQHPEYATWSDHIPAACLGCAAMERCRGGCRVCGEHTGDMFDPWMTDPLSPPPKVLPEFDDRAQARGAFTIIRPDGDHLIIARGIQIAVVSSAAATLLTRLQNAISLADVSRHFGKSGVSLVKDLAVIGMIDVSLPITATGSRPASNVT